MKRKTIHPGLEPHLSGGPATAPLLHRTASEALADVRELEDRGFTFVADDGAERYVSYAELTHRAARVARALLDRGYVPGDRIVLVLPDNEEFISIFLGCIWAGMVPVPIFPPLGVGRLAGYLEHAVHIVDASRATGLITDRMVHKVLGTLLVRCPVLRKVLTSDVVLEGEAEAPLVEVAPEATCFLQFTSGSTSHPKGVIVTHGALAENIRCIAGEGLEVRPDDVGVSWLPLFHDMGLIGFVLAPLFYRVPIVSLSPMTFLKRPQRWLEAMSEHRGTISFAPNFAYGLATRRIRDKHLEGLDLSAWRIAGCGAEPIRRETLDAFTARFAVAGFDGGAHFPVYGMAEATLAVTFGPIGRGMTSDSIDPEALESEQRARGARSGTRALEVVGCGRPFPNHDVAIVRTDGEVASEREVGEILLRGPSNTTGYFGNPRATRAALEGGWLHTGDLGYVAGGELFICGRSKELVIVGGKNYYPQDIEHAVWDLEDVRTGNVMAFGRDGRRGEELVVAVERRGTEATDEEVVASVRRRIAEVVGVQPADVVVLTPGSLPKTSSGKLQRARAKKLYTKGALTSAAPRTRRRDVARQVAASQLGYVRAFVGRVLTRGVTGSASPAT